MDKSFGCVVCSKGAPCELKEFDLRPLGEQDVEVDIICSGLCHTDVHMGHDDWGVTAFPLVAGHEGVGRVVAVGPVVKMLKVGDMVGIGWIRDCCGACHNCQKGEENICLKGHVGTIVTKAPGGLLNTGTFAKKVRIHERWAFPLPATLDPIKAAPLLCAGMTVYQPLRKYVTRPGMKVGIVGIGGLGHLAVKMARTMGAEVTVFSSSPDKEEEAKKFGAHHFVVTRDEAQLKAAENTIEFLLDTVPVPLPWDKYFAMLMCGGVMCLVGIPVDTLPIPTTSLVFGQKSIVGSIVSGSHVMNEMLHFCALHQLYPDCEIWDFKDINGAMARTLSGKARYRIVLKW